MLIFGITTYSYMHVVEYLPVCHCKGCIFAPVLRELSTQSMHIKGKIKSGPTCRI